MTQLSEYDRGYKIHKLALLNNRSHSGSSLSEDQKRILIKSKRIVLIFSEKFLKYEWSNKTFREFMKRVYLTDKDTVLVAVNLGGMKNEKINVIFKELSIRNVKTTDNIQVYTYNAHQYVSI